MNGWIKLYRKIMENPIVTKDADHLAIWIYLLLNATHDEYPALFRGQKISLQPGQLLTGRKAISERLAISESKVQRVLDAFKSEHQIEQQTSNKNRLISILNWDFYQGCEQQNEPQMNNKRTASEQQLNTNKNVKNNKNVKEDINNRPNRPTVEEVRAYCVERKNNVDPQKFVDFYTANGWVQGKGKPIKDWKAAVRTWERNSKPTSPKKNAFTQITQNDYDFDSLEKDLLSN